MGHVFVVKKSAMPISNNKDLEGKIIAVQVETISLSIAESIKNSGIKIKEIKNYPGATDTFNALKANQADIIITDEAVGKYFSALDERNFKVSGTASKPELIGIAIKKSNKNLYKEITKAMKTIKSNGLFNKTYQKWLKF